MARLQTQRAPHAGRSCQAAYRATRHGQLPARAFNESLPEGMQRIHPDIEKMTRCCNSLRPERTRPQAKSPRGLWRQSVLKKTGILDQRLRRRQGLLQSGAMPVSFGMLRQPAHETRALARLGRGRLQPRERDACGLRTQVVLRGTQMRGDGLKGARAARLQIRRPDGW